MKIIKSVLILLIILLTYSSGKSQDIHFSKFFSAPMILNPANTGNYLGNWRLLCNYRQQGTESLEPYKTAATSFDFPFYIKNEMASVGFLWLNDNSSDNTLSINKIGISSAYFVKISERSYLHMGLQAFYVNKKFSLNGLSFPDQFDMSTGYFNSNIETEEILQGESLSYIDLNWGLIWSFISEKFTSEIGVAMFHYNKPEETILGDRNRLAPKYSSHAYIEKLLVSKLYIKPKLLYTYQNKASELLIGSDIGLMFLENKTVKNVFIGAFFRGGILRNSDSFILKTGFNFKNYEFAIAYDYEISGQNNYKHTKNSYEISLSYIRPSTHLKNKTIPCSIF